MNRLEDLKTLRLFIQQHIYDTQRTMDRAVVMVVEPEIHTALGVALIQLIKTLVVVEQKIKELT